MTIGWPIMLMPFLDHLDITLMILAAVLLDQLLGEPRRFHPLAGFGRLARWVENFFYGTADTRPAMRYVRGLAAVSVLLIPLVLLAMLVQQAGISGMLFSVAVLYFAIATRSLREHAGRVADALVAGDLPDARRQVSMMVSRETAQLDEAGVARATVESVLENGNDAVFGALFWFALAGAPGVLLYRLSNTLDAMWGYRNVRYNYFGWAAARLDDVLNFIPARLTALTYALLGNVRTALRCWRQQAPAWDSPNAGPVMASGAGSLTVLLGGAANYHGATEMRPPLGAGNTPMTADIARATNLVQRGMWLWLALLLVAGIIANA